MKLTIKIFQFLKIGFVLILFFCVENITAQSFLNTHETDVVDESGKKILLRGVGLGNWMLPEGYMWKFGKNGDRPRRIEKIVTDCLGEEKAAQFWKEFRATYITEADIKRIAELGFNSVRPALNARLFLTEGENNEFVEEGFLLLDQLIGWCKKYKLYVIIDMHGAPGGQTGQNIDDSPNDLPELFMDSKNQDLLEKLWVKIAERYKDEPIVAAYDLLNEPLPEQTGAAAKHKNQLVPLYERLIKAIRAIDKKHMFTVEGHHYANNWEMFTKPLDNNTMYQFHYYCWDKPDNLNDITQYLEKQKLLNAPVWVGEFGEKSNAIYYGSTQLMEHYNIGWSFWPWKKMDTKNTPYSFKSPDGWAQIAAYSRGKFKLDSIVNAEQIFNELLENIKLSNCTYFPDVINALFRHIPVTIEAENYGHDGYGNSYFVKDTITKSVAYRKKEPVKISVFNKDKSEQAVNLAADEWLIYNCKSNDILTTGVTIRAKALTQPTVISISVNGKNTDLKVESTEWVNLKLQPQKFKKGDHQIKILVKRGSVQLDWIDIK
jgi:endoglucanase